jgi:hypothetical protein
MGQKLRPRVNDGQDSKRGPKKILGPAQRICIWVEDKDLELIDRATEQRPRMFQNRPEFIRGAVKTLLEYFDMYNKQPVPIQKIN